MSNFVLVSLFWLSIAGLAYIYAGYPILIWRLGRRWPKPVSVGDWKGSVSVVLVAYNEAGRIAKKLENLLASTSASQIVEILVGSDGSTDETAAAARAFPDPRVRVLDFAERRGKPAVLNDLVAQCRGEAILFVDARQNLAPTALVSLLQNLHDPSVGVVSGELVFLKSQEDSTAAEGVGLYWTYEKWIRSSESRFHSAPGATGAIYVLRRELFRTIPADTLLDDVVIPMQAVEQGYRCLLERDAEAYDHPSTSTGRESIRKRRTIAGCFQLLVRHPRWLRPSCNPICWQYASHKLARLFSPMLLATALAANICLASVPLYSVFLAVQFAFYVSAAVGWTYQHLGRRSALFGPSLMFVSLNTTTLFALWDAVRGRYRPAWQKSA
jgi:cellulose synthase/poly-beta-1,6-N-acetylglucosamine synthase-like glycosyltransferase